MVRITDTRGKSRADLLAEREARDRELAALRVRKARLHAERNAAAIAAEEEWERMTPEQRRKERERRRAEARARHEESNAAALAAERARKSRVAPAENKAITPPTDEKTDDVPPVSSPGENVIEGNTVVSVLADAPKRKRSRKKGGK